MLLYLIKYSRPDLSNAVRELSNDGIRLQWELTKKCFVQSSLFWIPKCLSVNQAKFRQKKTLEFESILRQ
jgi:hypothetical protein